MELTEHIESIRRQFAAAAEAGGDEAKAQAERLFAPLESAIRLALQDVLVAAAEEITCELAPGSVELRLRGREPEFVVSLPQSEPPSEEEEVRVSGLASARRGRGGHRPHQSPPPRAPEGPGGRGSRKRRPLDQHLAGSRHERGSGAKQFGSSPRPTAPNWISAIHRLEPVVRREPK